MNRDKENLSIKYNTSKDSKLSKKQNPLKPSEENSTSLDKKNSLKENKPAVNSRKNQNLGNAFSSKQNKPIQENQDKKKSVSPIANRKFLKNTSKNSNIETKNGGEKKQLIIANQNQTKSVVEANIVIVDKTIINTKSDEACVKSNCKNEKFSSGSSKNKRKFSIFAEENETERISFRNLENILDRCFKLFNEGNLEWLKIFREDIIKNEFEKEPENLTYLPISLTGIGSKILNLQIFWILWIEGIKHSNFDITIQVLINLFNQAFLNITEENLIKSYYLENIKRIDQSILKGFLNFKGVEFEDNSILTNDVYFGLLDSFSQFLLGKKRSILKTLLESSQKKKRSSNTENYLTCQDVTVTIPSNLRREFVNTQISQNENFVYSTNSSKSKIAFCNCKIILIKFYLNSLSVAVLDIENNNFQFKTPINIHKDISVLNKQNSDSYKKQIPKLIEEEDDLKSEKNSLSRLSSLSRKSDSQRQNSELRDCVNEPIFHHTQKTENMIVSQNTINKQIEFWNNLTNANSQNFFNLSQSNYDNDASNHINYSIYPNVTQETVNHENFDPFENNRSLENIDKHEDIPNPFCEENLSDKLKRSIDENDSNQDSCDNFDQIKEDLNGDKDLTVTVNNHNDNNDNNLSIENNSLEVNSENEEKNEIKKNIPNPFQEIEFNENLSQEKIKSPFKSFRIKSGSSLNESPKLNVENGISLNCTEFGQGDEINHFKDSFDNCDFNKTSKEVEEGSVKRIDEENLDSIDELESQRESYNNDRNNQIFNTSLNNVNSINLQSQHREHHSMNMSMHSNHSHSRSRSHRRSKYQSMITEEFPSDLVEGSIRTFNQSFSGVESIHKSERLLSNTKLKEHYYPQIEENKKN